MLGPAVKCSRVSLERDWRDVAPRPAEAALSSAANAASDTWWCALAAADHQLNSSSESWF